MAPRATTTATSTTATKPAGRKAAPPPPEEGVRTVHRPRPAAVKAGHLMAFTHYVNVESVRNGGAGLTVRDLDDNQQFTIDGLPLIERSGSADQFEETQPATKTKLAELLIESYHRAITVCWDKDDGNERTLRGRFVSHEKLMGRSYVEDLELPYNEPNRLRLVSHRTLKFLIVDGVKYELKK